MLANTDYVQSLPHMSRKEIDYNNTLLSIDRTIISINTTNYEWHWLPPCFTTEHSIKLIFDNDRNDTITIFTTSTPLTKVTPAIHWMLYSGQAQIIAWSIQNSEFIKILERLFQTHLSLNSIHIASTIDPSKTNEQLYNGYSISLGNDYKCSGIISFPAQWINQLPRQASTKQYVRFDYLQYPLPFMLQALQITSKDYNNISEGCIIVTNQTELRVTTTVANIKLGILLNDRQVTVINISNTTHLQPSTGVEMSNQKTIDSDNKISASTTIMTNKTHPAISIEALPVTLQFEVGQLSISLKDLQTLQIGTVYPMDKKFDDHVITLYANQQKIGYAELVNIDNYIGVRVTSIIDPV